MNRSQRDKGERQEYRPEHRPVEVTAHLYRSDCRSHNSQGARQSCCLTIGWHQGWQQGHHDDAEAEAADSLNETGGHRKEKEYDGNVLHSVVVCDRKITKTILESTLRSLLIYLYTATDSKHLFPHSPKNRIKNAQKTSLFQPIIRGIFTK